jgi:hypothetical protein
MPMYQPSPKVIRTLLNSESRGTLSMPISAIAVRILAQVESTIELTNRVCDRYLTDRARQPVNPFRPSAA